MKTPDSCCLYALLGTVKIMEWIGMTIALIILLVLILSFIGMWRSNTDKLTDYDLYGMDANKYLKKQVGEDYLNNEKHKSDQDCKQQIEVECCLYCGGCQINYDYDGSRLGWECRRLP